MKFSQRTKYFLQNAAIIALPFLLSMLCKTIRINIVNVASLQKEIEKGNNFIIAFWHGTMVIPWYYFRNKNMSTLISKSKDGEILTKTLESWKYNVIRGSSNDGGKEAFGRLLNIAAEKKSLMITADGPKGPAKKMKAGAVVISQRTQTTLLLLGIGYKNKIQLKSWDKLEIPLPFSKAKIVFSDKIDLNKDLSREDISAKIIEAENRLNDLQKEAVIS